MGGYLDFGGLLYPKAKPHGWPDSNGSKRPSRLGRRSTRRWSRRHSGRWETRWFLMACSVGRSRSSKLGEVVLLL